MRTITIRQLVSSGGKAATIVALAAAALVAPVAVAGEGQPPTLADAPAELSTDRAPSTARVDAELAPVSQTVGSPSLPDTVSNVVVRPDDRNPRVVWLEFDSDLLGLRAVNHVLLPPTYDEDAGPFGVLYHLHGTRGATALGDAALDAVGLAAAGSASTQTETFLVVSPDAGPEGWCNSCWWVDGRDGQGVLAESHLLDELIPVVEAALDVRRDRGGRAIEGSSMGGIGALIQAFRHPDTFAYVASLSGPASGAEHNDALQAFQDGTYYGTYLVGQGYPDPVTNPIAYRNIDVVTLAPQVVGTDLQIVLWADDGCLPPYDPDPQPVDDPECVHTSNPDPQHAFHMANEFGIRFDNEVLADRLIDLGVPFRLETGHGRHGSPNELYREHVVPDLNRLFASDVRDPRTFGYKATDRSFAVWGYEFEVTERANEEFLHVLGAETDGRAFTLAGTGSALVRTPPVARPGTPVTLTLIRENAPDETLTVLADDDCRVRIELTLGETRTHDQRRALSRQGLMPFPRTGVELVPDAPFHLTSGVPDAGACSGNRHTR